MKIRVLLIFLFLFTPISYVFASSPPSLTITSPEDGSFVNQTVIIEAELTTIPRVRSIKFYIDNELVGEDTESPYQYSWDTTTYPDGPHEIYASRLQAPERPPKIPEHPGPSDGGGSPILDSPKINVTVDNTPPITPTATDDGAYTTSLTELHATWTESMDPESGILEYQYSIGTSIGETDVVAWTSNGTNTEITHTGLTLSQGQIYYFNIKAQNQAGLWSEIGSSDGIVTNDVPLAKEVLNR